MSGKILGMMLFAVALVALFAGFQIVALLAAGVGLLLVVSAKASGRRHAHRGAASGSSRSAWFGSGTTSSDSNDSYAGSNISSEQCDSGGNFSVGSSDSEGGDCGGGGD